MTAPKKKEKVREMPRNGRPKRHSTTKRLRSIRYRRVGRLGLSKLFDELQTEWQDRQEQEAKIKWMEGEQHVLEIPENSK